METRQRPGPEESATGTLSKQFPLATTLPHVKPQHLPKKVTVIPTLRVNSIEAPTVRSGLQGVRGPIRAAPLAAKPQHSFRETSELRTATTLAKTARRLSAPIKRIGRLSNRRRGSYA